MGDFAVLRAELTTNALGAGTFPAAGALVPAAGALVPVAGALVAGALVTPVAGALVTGALAADVVVTAGALVAVALSLWRSFGFRWLSETDCLRSAPTATATNRNKRLALMNMLGGR